VEGILLHRTPRGYASGAGARRLRGGARILCEREGASAGARKGEHLYTQEKQRFL